LPTKGGCLSARSCKFFIFYLHFVDKGEDTALALPKVLSENYQTGSIQCSS
jgi:hypothetical protein